MKKMVICWVILVVGLVGVLTYIGLTYEKSVDAYKSFEADLVESANTYVHINKINTALEDTFIITESDFKKSGIITDFKVGDDECSAYVEITNSMNKRDYKAYINCKEYQTDGYTATKNSK